MSGKDEGSDGSNIGGFIFLLNNIPLYFKPEEEISVLRSPLLNVAATYILPLEQILSSRLNAAGFIRNIYVNFGPRGCCELNPSTKPVTELAKFAEQLRHLLQDGIIYNPENGEVACRMFTNLSSLVSTLPANCRKIGCMHGTGSLAQGPIMDFTNYIEAASDDQTLVFVIGVVDPEIHSYIDDFVKVCDYDLVATYGLTKVISAVEIKVGLV
ncbi:unnamed protein product [Sphenostylis stenocarpa]|uniref:Uncharacterized protein n=1 Tax=Sphenostylis stenocarpa TaxID=92480 RepID=A0AA86SHV9_9FABA|nr:unnamed protein product [Sphenostylis stenocarpa]